MNARTQSKAKQTATSGFILIYTLLFMSVLLVVFGTILNSSVNELRASGDEVESLKAFYAADTAIECVRYYQEKKGAFNTTAPATQYNCGVGSNFSAGRSSGATTCGTYTYNFTLTGFSNGTCADVRVDVAQNANDSKLCDMAVVATGKNSCSGTGSTIERTRWEGWVGLPVGSGNLESGLVGYWPFDEASGVTANDTSPGNNNDGTLTNSPIWIVSAGVSGSAIQFDGVDDYINVPNSTNYNATVGTWSGWIKTTQAVNLVSIMSRADASGTCSGITLYTANGSGGAGSDLRATIHAPGCGGAAVLDIGGGGVLNNGAWHHFVLTFDGQSTASLYLDGALVTSGTPSGAWSFGANPVRIGNALNSFWKNTNGTLDQIRIYNRVLTPAEITQLYNSRI